MSLSHSPKMVTDGLVFAYDTANTKKSWKGAPTTNLCQNNSFYSNWANSGAGIWNADDQDIPRLYQDLPLLSLIVTTAGNLHISHARASITAGLTYTVSTHIYIPSSAGTLAGSMPYIRTDPANTGRGTLTYNGNANWNTWPRDQWIRISQTFTNSANDTALYISCYLDALNNEVYFTGPQVENLSVMSGFTGGAGLSRSNTQAILDLTGNNTITANSLTYASDGIFSFNGSSDNLSIVNSTSLQVGETFTVNAWIRPTDLSARYGIFSTRTVNTVGSWQLEVGAASAVGAGGIGRVAVTGIGTWIWESSNNLIATNTWSNICFVKPNNTTQGGSIYVNGTLITPATTTAYTIANNSDAKIVGFGTNSTQYFPGQIRAVSLYNRALSAAEVYQNFNALRGRYGI